MRGEGLSGANVPRRRQSDFSVPETENPLQLMVDSVVDYAFFMLSPQGIVATWNSGASRIKGYTAEEIVGQHFSVFYPPEAIAQGLPDYELAIASATGRYEDEGWRVRKDLSQFWASVVLTAMRSRDGRLVGFAKVTRDLTEKRAAEETLRLANEEKARIALDLASANSYLRNVLNASTAISVIATDEQGTITLFNRGAETMLGYLAEEMVGKHTPALFHDAGEVARRAEELSQLLGRAVGGFEVFTSSIGNVEYGQREWTYVRKDGRELTVRLSLSTVLGDTGQVVGYLGVAEDVTERHLAAQQTAEAYARLNAVLESTTDSVMTLGHDWTMLYANKRALEELPEVAIGQDYWTHFPTVLGTPTGALLRQAMSERTEVRYEIFYTPHAAWFRGHAFPTEDGLTVFFSDISEEKQMQERLELERLLRERRIGALSHMAGGLAHEINNPLAIIHARASDLRALAKNDEPVSADEVRAATGSIVHTCDRAMRILRGLRGFAREAGSDPLEFASVYDIVENCLDLQESRFQRHRVELRVSLAKEIPLLLCRETQIGQIVTNLLSNAFDAIDQSGSQERWVSLTAGTLAGHLWVDVTDSGPPIEDAFRAHLMDPFFNVKERGVGMGVGLSLSNAIAEDHGGTLVVAGETSHACFRLTLPFRADGVGAGIAGPTPAQIAAGAESVEL